MTTLFEPLVLVWMGDSLSAGTITIGDVTHPFINQLDLDETLFPRLAVACSAKNSDTIELVQTRYTQNVKDQGYDGVALMIGVNNFNVSNQSAATAWAALEPLIDEILDDGLPVLLVMESGWSDYSNWTVGKQANYVAFRELVNAKTGVTHLDLYQPYPLGLNDPDNPTALKAEFSIDGLHLTQAGNDHVASLAAPLLAAMFPESTPVVVAEISSFGVSASIIRADYFSQMAEFSSESNPSSTSVARYIQQKGAELAGKLRQESQTPADIEADSSTEAYAWCQETLSLMVACRCAEDMQQARPALADTWEKRLAERLEDLAANGYLALGDGSAVPVEQPDGPNTFIDSLNLDTSSNEDNASSVDMPFHKDDLL